MRLKLPTNEKFRKSNIEDEPNASSPFIMKVAVDNRLAGLEEHLRKSGFKDVVRPPYFSDLPKNTPYPHKKCRNQISRNKAVTRWLNKNGCKVFITNRADEFLVYWIREYALIKVESDLMEDYQLLAKKVNILFGHASHP